MRRHSRRESRFHKIGRETEAAASSSLDSSRLFSTDSSLDSGLAVLLSARLSSSVLETAVFTLLSSETSPEEQAKSVRDSRRKQNHAQKRLPIGCLKIITPFNVLSTDHRINKNVVTKTAFDNQMRIFTTTLYSSSLPVQGNPNGDKGIRTPDLLNAIQARSQLRYTPKTYCIIA